MDMSLSKLWETGKDREAWRGAVHGGHKSRTRLSDWTTIEWNKMNPLDWWSVQTLSLDFRREFLFWGKIGSLVIIGIPHCWLWLELWWLLPSILMASHLKYLSVIWHLWSLGNSQPGLGSNWPSPEAALSHAGWGLKWVDYGLSLLLTGDDLPAQKVSGETEHLYPYWKWLSHSCFFFKLLFLPALFQSPKFPPCFLGYLALKSLSQVLVSGESKLRQSLTFFLNTVYDSNLLWF